MENNQIANTSLRDLTQGGIFRQLFSLALPLLAISFIQMAYNLVDIIWIGRLGSEAVAAVGCVIQGETPHFTFVCESVTEGTTKLNLENNIPVIFGLLTTNTEEQATARSGGRHGNKGDEAAITALKMIELKDKYI